jgi:hypothetical protein
MLKITVHSGLLATRCPGNQLCVLDIAYAKKTAVANYLVALSLKGQGEVAPDMVTGYPRWSGSLWDLTARALTRVLYRADQAPLCSPPDKRCAYATRVCAVIERSSLHGSTVKLASVEITQAGNERGVYTAKFEEDISGSRTVDFTYGLKSLNPADLLLRAICWALFGKEVLGPAPALIVPPFIKVDGVERFHVDALNEPAKTGFARYRRASLIESEVPEPMAKGEDYVRFLIQG